MVPVALPHRPANLNYWPMLRARRGELEALAHLCPTLVPLVTPVLQVAATARGPVDAAVRFVQDLRDRPPAGLNVAVDLAELPDDADSGRSIPGVVATWLADRKISMLPVLRLGDSGHRLAGHGAAARLHLDRAAVRFRPDECAPGAAEALAAVHRVCQRSGLAPEQCDLLIDLDAVGSRAAAQEAETAVRRIAGWLRRLPWRSMSVIAGAMPPSLAGLPTDEPVRLWRWDRALWGRVADLGLAFGDYGVVSPAPAPVDTGGSSPTIRYTADDVWWIYRWARRGGRSDDRCYSLCHALVAADHWPAAGAAYSWGDHEIARRARYAPGPGTPSSWIAWGTSHHLAHVARSLAAQRTPDDELSA